MLRHVHPRSRVIAGIFLGAILVIILQLAYIQLWDASYRNRAEDMTVHKKTINPSRGLIYDRNGKLLVDNKRNFQLLFSYKHYDPERDYSDVYKILGITKEKFLDLIEKDWSSKHFDKNNPYVIYPNLKEEQYNMLQEHRYRFPALQFREKSVRTYPVSTAANIVGYMSEVNVSQLKNKLDYSMGDYIGSKGLEASYEKELKGQKGLRYVLRNKFGREVSSFKDGALDIASQKGKDLELTIDSELQSFAEKLLSNKRGAIVALNPSNGEILCMATGPNFDPNLLAIDKNRAKVYRKLLNDPEKPLFDRSIMAKYPPGSIFKTLIALIALELGVTDANRYIPCSGMYYYNGIPFKCHQHPPTNNIQTALQYSCNTYFRLLLRDIVDIQDFYAPEVGLDTLHYFTDQCMLGQELGIDIEGESGGNIPSKEFYTSMYPTDQGSWKSPTIMSIGIGQGEIEMSNLQIAHLASIIANRGSFKIPHLVKSIGHKEAAIPQKYKETHSLSIHPEHYEPVIEGMRRVITNGTGRQAAIPDISLCGKTGTSQNPHGEDHSVFFGFAPQKHPDIAFSVFLENAGAGGILAASMAGLIVEKYLRDSLSDHRRHFASNITEQKILLP